MTGKRLRAVSHRLSKDRDEAKSYFLSELKAKLAERKYRADLALITDAKDVTGTFSAEVRFNPSLGHPTEKDILSLVAQNYDMHDVNWEYVNVDPDAGIVTLYLQPSVEVIPVESIQEVPPEFTAIGTGLYKRAADSSGNVAEIWSLKKTDDGLALYRNPDDLEVTADDDEGLTKGSVVDTPHGPGIVQRFDELGNPFVQVGNKIHLVAVVDTDPYEISKEKQALIDYYTQVYGDAEFAKQLVTQIEPSKQE